MAARISLTVNGTRYEHVVEANLLLVSYLRDTLGLTGTHVGCDTSQCGACTVMLDGVAVKACTVLTVQADGAEVGTVEGLARDGELHPLQKAFWEKHGLQCGYCTPGMLIAASDLLATNHAPDEAEIRHALSGVLCRCTGYQSVVESVKYAVELTRERTLSRQQQAPPNRS